MSDPAQPLPPPSTHLEKLRQRINALRDCFLPTPFAPTGDYPAEQATKTHAFRVLSHAEVEVFFEGRSREIALASVRAWKRDRQATRTLVCLLAFSGREHDAPPPTLVAPQVNKKDDWEELLEVDRRIDAAVSAFFARLKANHGVKEENILSLLLPIGVARQHLDPQLLAELNSFGSARGESAHQGVLHLKEIPDPLSEHKRVQQIIELIVPIDLRLSELLAGTPEAT